MSPGRQPGAFSSASAYDRFIGRYGSQLARALLDAAGDGTSERALDVGCGPGALTAELAERLGAGRVSAVDPSEPFVASVRERLPGVEAAVASAEKLPFEDGAFDLVLAQLVVNFMSDPAAGVAEMRRVAAPGATVASCVWDYGGEMTLLRAFWDAAAEVEPEEGPAHDEARTMPHCERDALAKLWEQAGLNDVSAGELTVSAEYDDFNDLWGPFEAGVGPAGSFAAGLNLEPRVALRDAFRKRLGDPPGPFSLGARAWYASGRRP